MLLLLWKCLLLIDGDAICFFFWRWRGNYGGKVQLWFPANYVEEVSAAEDDNDASPLGSLQKGTIDLTGVTVGQHAYIHIWVFVSKTSVE